MESSAAFTQLLDKYLTQTITAEELELFLAIIRDRKNVPDLETAVAEALETVSFDVREDLQLKEALFQRILKQRTVRPAAHRVHFLRRTWVRYAAAIILFLGITTAIVVSTRQNKPGKDLSRRETPINIPPGSNKAILSIGNDQAITLSGDKTGITVGSTISYNDGEQIADAGRMLQLSTPRGGQYQAVLPDGSKVWLNAASSIKFPSAFNNKERRVEVTGEAYFEIAKDVNRPFKIDGGGQEIEVLGTSFNINIYADEPIRKTTLITGSIKITSNNQTAILKPGQQANISMLEIPKIQLMEVQTNEVLAWKNGLFNFEGLPLSSVMKQLERWYDIDTKYDEKTGKLIFRGELYRNLPLKNALEILKDMGIKYELHERTLTILGATW